MLYIHQTSCISPQATYSQPGSGAVGGGGVPGIDAAALGIGVPRGPVDNMLKAIEPSYEGIPGSILRRMSKSVKMGVGAALPLLSLTPSNPRAELALPGSTDSSTPPSKPSLLSSAVPTASPSTGLSLQGILIGTGNGGMEDSVKFLKQIIDYEEGLLTPGTFVQNTANAIASQIGLLHQNNG
jgi:hypothetical protein